MALAFSRVLGFHKEDRFSVGSLHVWFVDVTLDTDYPDAGWSVTPADLFATNIIGVVPMGVAKSSDSETGVPVVYDHVNEKLVIMTTGASSGAVLAEAANGLDGAANLVVRLQVWGYPK